MKHPPCTHFNLSWCRPPSCLLSGVPKKVMGFRSCWSQNDFLAYWISWTEGSEKWRCRRGSWPSLPPMKQVIRCSWARLCLYQGTEESIGWGTGVVCCLLRQAHTGSAGWPQTGFSFPASVSYSAELQARSVIPGWQAAYHPERKRCWGESEGMDVAKFLSGVTLNLHPFASSPQLPILPLGCLSLRSLFHSKRSCAMWNL